MNLDKYLHRIQYDGSRRLDVGTLTHLHRSHLQAIPYENLDIHLGKRLGLDIEQTYTKIVEGGRGGWCYEMNGLFAWALRELGFSVTLLGSAVGGAAQGDAGDLDHLILQVDLEDPWLADVGFGNGILEPLPLRPGIYQQGVAEFRLEQNGDKWYFHNHVHGGAGYGFTLLPREYGGFAPRCHELQTAPESGFVRTTVCHHFTPWGFASLRGAILQEFRTGDMRKEEIADKERYRTVLAETFGLKGNLADALWPGVEARHRVWKEQEP